MPELKPCACTKDSFCFGSAESISGLCAYCERRCRQANEPEKPKVCVCESSVFTRCRRQAEADSDLCARCAKTCKWANEPEKQKLCVNSACPACGGPCRSAPATGSDTCYACQWLNKPTAPTLPAAREGWDEYFFGVARMVATRATCPRASIGVVLAGENHRIIATGYNGAPSGEPHCTDDGVGCDMFADHCVRATHAEANALESAWQMIGLAADWELTSDDPDYFHNFLKKLQVTAYIVGPRAVCSACARLLRDAGVAAVKVQES